MEKNIIHIPAKTMCNEDGCLAKKKKVAAYARVSTDKEQQITSYESQLEYYERYIKSNKDWIFAKLYSDEGISGTSFKNRKGFLEMIEDAKKGKIDLILTKSISRFSRNVIDSLTKIKELKECGVEVFFEKENISSTDPKTEFIFTIMATVAQEESRSLSMNISWGYHKRFQKGVFSMPYNEFLGYEKGNDGKMKVNLIEANIVKRIFYMFLQGVGPSKIGQILTNEGIETPGHKSKWHTSTVISILKNEKYKGDALLQKTINVDYLSKKRKKNNGELDQYYIKNSHEPIISANDFEKVQEKIRILGCSYARRSEHLFSNLIYCNECGFTFGYRIWHKNTKHESCLYTCNQFRKKPHNIIINLNENYLVKILLNRLSRLTKNKDYHTILNRIIEANLDITFFKKEINVLKADINLLRKKDNYEERITSDLNRIKELYKHIKDLNEYAYNIEELIYKCILNGILSSQIIDFLILKINAYDKNNIEFILKDGTIL